MKVIDFLRYKKDNDVISGSLKDPLFIVIIEENNEIKELDIQMHGEIPVRIPLEISFYDEEAQENYRILKEFLATEEGQEFLERNNLDEDKFILGLYKALVNFHSCFGWFKKKLLVILKYLEYYSGKLGS